MKIVKGCMIPVFQNGQYLNAIEIQNETLTFNSVIESAINFIKKIQKKIDTPDDLRKFNDTYVLLIDSLFSSMRRHTAIHLISYFFKKDLKTEVESFYQKFKSKSAEFLAIPADTRPLANASSLWIHMKTTSALAVINYLSIKGKESTPENRELLRFASLFHDLGKPFDRKKHVTEASKILTQFFKHYLKEEYLTRITEWISKHHDSKAEAFAKIIQDADRVSSGIERHRDFIKEKLIARDPVKFKWVEEAFDNWDNWERLEPELMTLTSDLISEFREERETVLSSQRGSSAPESSPTIALVMCDARGIKDFVDNSLKLKEIKGGAILIDEALTIYSEPKFKVQGILSELYNFNIPPECIIFYGGGNVLFFADIPRIKQIKKAVRDAFLKVVRGGVGLTVVHQEFELEQLVFFGTIYKEILIKMGQYKNELLNVPKHPIELGFKRLCSSCYATKAEYLDEENKWICSACFRKREIGASSKNPRAFKTAWQTKYEENLGDWKTIMEKIPEFISGMALADIQKKTQEIKPSIAVIKADGNNMGQFFGSSLTITELIEKSIKTDIAMDLCIEELKEIIRHTIHTTPNSKHQEEMLARIDLGIIYAGGDDFLMFAPAWLSIPIALIFMERFAKIMGNLVKLSVGIVIGDPKQPQNYLIKAAEYMLDNAKTKSRNDPNSTEIMGYLDYESVESGTYTPDIIEHNRNLLSKGSQMYIGRPFKIPFWEINTPYPFRQILQDIGNKKINNPAELISLIHENLQAIRQKDKKVQLRELRNRLLEILNLFKYESSVQDINYGAIYAIYQYSRKVFRSKPEIKEIYNKIGLSLAASMIKNEPISLIDEYIMIKLMGGGFL
ncbi:MAG: Cas10/Cmr2 second palm domain-containing protein [Candidatus Helarchaeota archaeon]